MAGPKNWSPNHNGPTSSPLIGGALFDINVGMQFHCSGVMVVAEDIPRDSHSGTSRIRLRTKHRTQCVFWPVLCCGARESSRPWSETMVSIPLRAQKALEIKGFLGLERPFLDLVLQTPRPRGRGRPLFAEKRYAACSLVMDVRSVHVSLSWLSTKAVIEHHISQPSRTASQELQEPSGQECYPCRTMFFNLLQTIAAIPVLAPPKKAVSKQRGSVRNNVSHFAWVPWRYRFRGYRTRLDRESRDHGTQNLHVSGGVSFFGPRTGTCRG